VPSGIADAGSDPPRHQHDAREVVGTAVIFEDNAHASCVIGSRRRRATTTPSLQRVRVGGGDHVGSRRVPPGSESRTRRCSPSIPLDDAPV